MSTVGEPCPDTVVSMRSGPLRIGLVSPYSVSLPGGVQGQTTTITIQLRDQFGNAVTTGGANVLANVTGANPGAAVVADLGTGIYLATYLPQNAGTVQIGITLNGTPIGGSPYASLVQ